MGQAQVSLREGYKAAISTGGHTVYTDEPVSDGGEDFGPTPKSLMIGTLGACVAVTVKLYANRKGWPLEGVDVDVQLERIPAADYPAYEGTSDFVHEFKQKITFHGPLSEEQRARLLEIAGKCPIHRVLTQPVFIEDELVEPANA